jgi:recombination protein RecT
MQQMAQSNTSGGAIGNTALTAFKVMTERYKPQLVNTLPKHLSIDRFLGVAYELLRKNPKLGSCSPDSFFSAILRCAQIGLEPGELVYLVPFKGEVSTIIGYLGLLELVYRSQKVKTVYAEVAYKFDVFDVMLGSSPSVKHIPKNGERTNENIMAVYAVAKIDDSVICQVMYLDEIINAMQRSVSWRYADSKNKDSIWHMHFVQMAKKTVLRRLITYLPKSAEIIQILHDGDS